MKTINDITKRVKGVTNADFDTLLQKLYTSI